MRVWVMAAWSGEWDTYTYNIVGVFSSEPAAFAALPGHWTFGTDGQWHLPIEDSHLANNYEVFPMFLDQPEVELV